ncbi:hypothetical protein [Sphingopyxis fribergensis]|jgi:hypothetical protein
MAARNTSLDNELQGFAACFRAQSGHLIFSTSPGGEGRVVSEDEAVGFWCNYAALSHRHARRFGHSVWASVVLLILFGTLGVKYRMPLLTGLALLSMFGWWFTAIAQRIIRACFKYRVWDALAHHTPVRALTRHEKIARGFALSVGQWLMLGVALIAYAALSAPSRALPPEWRDVQMLAIAVVMFGALLALLAFGAVRLVRRLRRRG